MKAHYISHIHIEKLWGSDKAVTFPLNDDVNIIIGPNASGKTTIINLLRRPLETSYDFSIISSSSSESRSVPLIPQRKYR